jgi:glycosyltransferase involved in cell wall biosynthesis
MNWPVPGKLAFVVPRYGAEVLGGAESVVRELAPRIAARGLGVEVLTTCAIDHYTWANAYPPGPAEVDGVMVRRFPGELGKGQERRRLGPMVNAGIPISVDDQEKWVNDGFRSAALFHYLLAEHGRYHTIVLTPYLTWMTYACAQIAPGKNVLRPCLHDEPEARLEIFRPVFRDARGITFNSPPEAELATQMLELPRRWEVVGEGVELSVTHDAERFRARYGIQGPFALYVGRREWGKNIHMLLEYFGRYVARGGRAKLVLVGGGDVPVPAQLRGAVVELGFLPEQDKLDAYSAATVVCQPSTLESFSRLLMEAWLASTPVLVYRGGAVTSYFTAQSGGGLFFGDAAEFEVALEVLITQPELRDELGRAGRSFVLRGYGWDSVVERFIGCIRAWASEDGVAMSA